MVFCEVQLCPYRTKEGFCKSYTLFIKANGGCSQLYDKHGQIKSDWQKHIDEKYMKKITIYEKE